MLNTSYFTDSYIIFSLKMDLYLKIQFLAKKKMVKSGLEFYFFFEIPLCERLFFLTSKKCPKSQIQL